MSTESGEPIVWRVHLASPRERVFEFLSTDEGRARFWAESAIEGESGIKWCFPNGMVTTLEVLESTPPSRYSVRYLGRSTATFTLVEDRSGGGGGAGAGAAAAGTDLTLEDVGVPLAWRDETQAGWVSVLLALKAAVDFGVDLRNHHPDRNWDQRYADN